MICAWVSLVLYYLARWSVPPPANTKDGEYEVQISPSCRRRADPLSLHPDRPGAFRRARRNNGQMQRRYLHFSSQEAGRMPRPQRNRYLVCKRRCGSSLGCSRRQLSSGCQPGTRCSPQNQPTRSCHKLLPGNVLAEIERPKSGKDCGSRRWTGPCMGEFVHQRLPLLRKRVLRHNQGGKIYVRG